MSVLKETLSIKGLSRKVSLALFAMVSISMASHASAKTVNDIIKSYYPIYNETKQCRGIFAKDGSSSWEGQYNKSGYCIKVDMIEVFKDGT